MKQNTQRDRICVLLALSMLQVAHQYFFGDVQNTPEGLLMYHGAAALADFYLIYVASELLSGELGFQIQCLSLASMVTNAVGYFAYLQYISHWFYDLTMWSICSVLIFKLLWIPRYDPNHLGGGVVFHNNSSSRQLHTGKASR